MAVLATKAVSAPIKEEALWKYFMLHVVQWHWPHRIKKFDETCLVVADQEFIDRLQKQGGTYNCSFKTQNDLDKMDLTRIEKILVFLMCQERETVARLKKSYPDKIISSGTYEFSVVDANRIPRMQLKRRAPSKAEKGPVVIVATPNSDAEYLVKTMEMNGLPAPWEYIGRPYISWMKLRGELAFHPLVETAAKRYATDQGIAYLFHTDVLAALFDNTDFSLGAFVEWLQAQQARVILINRRDILMQAYICGQFKNTHERSPWTLSRNRQLTFKNSSFNSLNVLEVLAHLRIGENILGDIAARMTNVHSVVLEDMLEDIEGSIAAIANHIGETPADVLATIEHESCIELMPNLIEVQREFKRQILDRLGITATDLLGG